MHFILLFLTEEPIAGRTQTQNMGFILFLVCFFILIYQVGKNAKLLIAMTGKLFGNKSQTTPDELFNRQFPNIILFSVQTILLTAIIVYCIALDAGVFKKESPSGMFIFLGFAVLLLSFFIIYKYITYYFTGYVFFDKEASQRWINTVSSAICLSGIVLFIPALILFYVEEAYIFVVYVILIYYIFVQIIVLYRQFVLFFNKKSSLLYFILYLCTQEIIPLFLLYKGFVYLFFNVKG